MKEQFALWEMIVKINKSLQVINIIVVIDAVWVTGHLNKSASLQILFSALKCAFLF